MPFPQQFRAWLRFPGQCAWHTEHLTGAAAGGYVHTLWPGQKHKPIPGTNCCSLPSAGPQFEPPVTPPARQSACIRPTIISGGPPLNH